MNDETSSQGLPLRRITRSARIVASSHLTTRPRIGRLASSTQTLANSLGRPATMRRSISEAAPVKYPSWLLPSIAGRSDGLDQWRDRDLIAIRRARSKNRVVRQVPPRGLPMASHARGRGRIGEQVAPSSIARRLQPVRRTPTPNDAHANVSQVSAVRPATPRPPRARRLALPPGKSGDRDVPAGRSSTVFPGPVVGSLASPRSTLPLVVGQQSRSTTPAAPRTFSAPMPKRPSTSSASGSATPRSRSESRVTRRATRSAATRRTGDLATTSQRPARSLQRARPEWTTFGAPDSVPALPHEESPQTNRTPTPGGSSRSTTIGHSTPNAPRIPAPTSEPPASRSSRVSQSSGPVRRRARTTSRVVPAIRRAEVRADWRRVAGLAPTDARLPSHVRTTSFDASNDISSGQAITERDAIRRSSARRSTLAERVALLADPSITPRDAPGSLVRRSPVAGSMFTLAAAIASSTSTTGQQSSSSPSPVTRSPRRSTTKGSTLESMWRRATQSSDVEAASTARRSFRSTPARVASTHPGDVARRRERATDSTSRRTEGRRRAADRRARRSPSVERLLDSSTPVRRSAMVVAPGGTAASPFVGSLVRAIARRQQTGGSQVSSATSSAPKASRSSFGPSGTFSAAPTPRTGPGAEAAQSFAERFARRTGQPVAPANSGAEDSRGPVDDLLSRSLAARTDSGPPTTPAASLRTTSDSASAVATPARHTTPVRAARLVGDPSMASTAPIAYRAATAPRPAAIRRSVPEDLPVAPIVLPPQRDLTDRTLRSDSTPGPSGSSRPSNSATGASVNASVRPGPGSLDSASPSTPSRTGSRPSASPRTASRSVSVRRSSRGPSRNDLVRRSTNGGADDTVSADALARMIEHGFEPDMTRTVTRKVDGTTSSPVRRSPRSTGAASSGSTGGSTSIIRRSKAGLASIAPGPIAIVGTVSGGADSLESSSGVTTSQLLDLVDWINRVVDERLRLELERRGMTGGRW